MNKFSLSGKRALITGGTRGLGQAIAKAFIENGAEVIITGRTQEGLDASITQLGNQCRGALLNVDDLESIEPFVHETEKKYGSIDILVNNAGINQKKEIPDVTDEDYARIILTNQQAVFALTREMTKRMLPRKTGCIIMISSMASQYGIPKVIAYTASKAAVEGMTKAMAVELSPFGIRVNCIAPGFIETDMSSKALNSDPERKQKVLSRTPMAKLGKPEDIGNAAVFLSSDAASFITGIVLPVDGGNSIGF
ncbi:MAG: 3-oxoacyl-ACP reductase FabG [Chitinophagaceae bacterium]|nr:3-oxoacyl-ACP reductase FabG [Chitinophagaceae bacterium]MCW5928337.1 3-oxoacyl-ACP reductase FabG [Chitinophagaceae bacterium]